MSGYGPIPFEMKLFLHSVVQSYMLFNSHILHLTKFRQHFALVSDVQDSNMVKSTTLDEVHTENRWKCVTEIASCITYKS